MRWGWWSSCWRRTPERARCAIDSAGEWAMNPRKVGMVGLGLLGAALAERLLGAGFAVVGFDRDPRRCQLLAELGGEPVTSALEVIHGCDRVLLSLPDTATVESVLEEM